MKFRQHETDKDGRNKFFMGHDNYIKTEALSVAEAHKIEMKKIPDPEKPLPVRLLKDFLP